MRARRAEARQRQVSRFTANAAALLVGTALLNVAVLHAAPPVPALAAGASLIVLVGLAVASFLQLSRRLTRERSIAIAAQRDLARLANEDPLTRLANRAWFGTEIHRAVGEAVSGDNRLALVLLDLNRFKSINDTFGHAAGDAVLVAAAHRIRGAMGDSFNARLGGDEFGILVEGFGSANHLAQRLSRLSAALAQPVLHEGMEIATGASIGVALCPDHATDAARLQTLADRALYRAKSLGGGTFVLDGAMIAATQAEDGLINDIPRAFRNGEFCFHYQTKVRLSDGAHVGFEALARWQHPRLGVIYPDTFIPLLERMGLMIELTRRLLDDVAADIAAWRVAGLTPGPVAVNLPEAILGTNVALRQIEEALGRHNLPWSALTVELTEDVFIDRALSQIEANVLELSRRGARVALDDFGTGYASLSHLRSFPFDEIKIDRSFIAEIGHDANSERIAAAMIALGRDLGKAVVAEGIETPEQRAWLREHGCNLGQGFLFGRPEPVEAAASRIASVSGLIEAARKMQSPATAGDARKVG